MDDLVGTSMRGYKVKECIGNVGYGGVYRASHLYIECGGAIKVNFPFQAETEYFKNRTNGESCPLSKV